MQGLNDERILLCLQVEARTSAGFGSQSQPFVFTLEGCSELTCGCPFLC